MKAGARGRLGARGFSHSKKKRKERRVCCDSYTSYFKHVASQYCCCCCCCYYIIVIIRWRSKATSKGKRGLHSFILCKTKTRTSTKTNVRKSADHPNGTTREGTNIAADKKHGISSAGSYPRASTAPRAVSTAKAMAALKNQTFCVPMIMHV